MRILLVNQTIGPLFNDVIQSLKSSQDIVVFKSLAYNRTNLLSRFASWSLYTLHLFFYLLIFSRRFDQILYVTNPPLSIFTAFIVRVPFSILIYDLYPQALNQLSFPNFLFNFVSHIWNYFANHVYKNSFRLITLTESMAEEILSNSPQSFDLKSKLCVIPPWADVCLSSVDPSIIHSLNKKYAIDSRTFLVSYTGNLGLTHPLEHLVSAAKLLYGTSFNRSLKFLIVGSGAKKSQLASLANSLSLPSRYFLFSDPLPYRKLPSFLSQVSISVIALDSLCSKVSLPSKTFNYLACGCPILAICSTSSALAEIIQKFNCGYVIDPSGDAAKSIAIILSRLDQDPVLLKKLSDNALKASEFFDRKNSSLFSRVLSSATTPYA